MTKGRLEAFSDGVIAIIITIMVLELEVPNGASLHALVEVLPSVATYVLSFVFLGIYWSNHHHMLHACDRITGGVLWANLHLLFWLSLVPYATAYMEQQFDTLPAAVYGLLLLLAAIAYYVLQSTIVRAQGPGSKLKQALGHDLKGKLSPVLYVLGIGLAFVSPWLAVAIYVAVALMWLVPDRRIERKLVGVRS